MGRGLETGNGLSSFFPVQSAREVAFQLCSARAVSSQCLASVQLEHYAMAKHSPSNASYILSFSDILQRQEYEDGGKEKVKYRNLVILLFYLTHNILS